MQILQGGAETCDCSPCRNFAGLREQLYPPEVRTLFKELGVDYRRDAEAYHICRLPNGKHSYGAWFHFVGMIEAGKDAEVPVGENSWTFDLERVSEGFSLGFTAKTGLVPEAFSGKPVVQIEIEVEAPWMIPDPEPD